MADDTLQQSELETDTSIDIPNKITRTGRLDELTAFQKVLTTPFMDEAISMISGGMTLEEADELKEVTLKSGRSMFPQASMVKGDLSTYKIDDPGDVLRAIRLTKDLAVDLFKEDFEGMKNFITNPIKFLHELPYSQRAGFEERMRGKDLKDFEGLKNIGGNILTPFHRMSNVIQQLLVPDENKPVIEGATYSFLRPEEIESGRVGGQVTRNLRPEPGQPYRNAVKITAGTIAGTAVDFLALEVAFGGFASRLRAGYKTAQIKGAAKELDAFGEHLAIWMYRLAERGGKFPKGMSTTKKFELSLLHARYLIETTPYVGDFFLKRQTPSKILFKDRILGKAGELKWAPENVALKSNLKAVAYSKLPNTVSGVQALKILLNSGLTSDELQYSGVVNFLKDKDKVTKEEVVNFIEENKVKIEEVVKRNNTISQSSIKKSQIENAFHERGMSIESAIGGEDILITDFSGNDIDDETLEQRYPELFEMASEYESLTGKTELHTKYSEYTLHGGDKYREVLLKLPVKLGSPYPTFYSSHWDEPNVIVHIRLDDIVDSEGKNVLFVEEIQSDWHREGKSKGYGDKLLTKEDIIAVKKGEHRYWEATDKEGNFIARNAGNMTEDSFKEYVIAVTATKGVPDAPFKNTWHELGLKKAIEIAVAEGYDKVAFISGQQTADRYGLSKQVDFIRAEKLDDGAFSLVVRQSNNNSMIVIKEKDELADFIGKELAEKIINQKEEQYLYVGFDLKVGGEWAKKFYDEILPRTAEKYIKKWGGKIEDIKIDTGKYDDIKPTQKGFYLTPTMIKEVSEMGQPLFGSRLSGSLEELLKSKRGMAGTQESFPLPDEWDAPEIPGILAEIKRVSEIKALEKVAQQGTGDVDAQSPGNKPPKKPPIAEGGGEYEKNREIFKGNKKGGKTKASLAEFVNKTFVPISTRLSIIDESLRDAIRKHIYAVNMGTKKDMEAVIPFLKKFIQMKEDAIDLDFALKNGDVDKVAEKIAKHGVEKEYAEVRKVLEDIHKRAEASGMDIGYLPNYFPRRIADLEGLLAYLRGGANWEAIRRAIEAEEEEVGRALTDEQKAEVINSMIPVLLSKFLPLPSNVKERKIEQLTPEMNAYYKDSGVALTDYIRSMNDNIEARNFFGKGKNLDKSIGNYVVSLVENGTIKPADEETVRQIMHSYFSKRGTRGIVTGFKNFSYIVTMGSPISAITQIGDLAFALYENGFYGTVKAALYDQFKEGRITKKDIGLDIIAEEFTDQSRSSKAVSKVFKMIGLEALDSFFAENIINGAFDKLIKQANSNDPGLISELQRVFSEGYEQVLQDFKDGVPTYNVKYILFSRLAKYQPKAISELPEYWVSGGNLRIFYMLKSYTIKQFDVYHNEIIREKDPAKKAQNLLKLTLALMLTGATADVIKDTLLGRKIKLDDLVVNNILKLVGSSKWQIYTSRMDGLFQTFLQTILPPVPFVDDLYKDLIKYSNKDKPKIENFRIWQRIPLVGKLYYWWFGGGSEYNKKDKKIIIK